MNTLQDFQCNEICIKTLQGVSHNVRSLPFVLIAALEGQKKKREYLVLFFFSYFRRDVNFENILCIVNLQVTTPLACGDLGGC